MGWASACGKRVFPFADRARDRQPCVAGARRARIVHLDDAVLVEQAD
jgi:hypothetical protein